MVRLTSHVSHLTRQTLCIPFRISAMLNRLILLDNPIPQSDDALRVLRDIRFMGNQDDRDPLLVEFLENRHHIYGRPAV